MISNSGRPVVRYSRPPYDRNAAIADFEIFDALPKPIREAVAGLAVSFRSELVASDVADVRRAAQQRGDPEGMVIAAVCVWQAQREAQDIAKCAFDYWYAYNEPLPHVAAEATVMRSDGPPRRLRRRPRYGRRTA